MLSGSSTSATSRLQPAGHDCVPRPSPSRTSHVTLGGLYRRITCCPPTCPSHEPGSDSEFGSSAFPRRTGCQYPDCQYPWLTGRQCPHSAAVSFAPSESVPRGSQAVSPLDPQKAHGQSVPPAVLRHPSQSPVARRPSLVAPCSNDGLAAVPARATSVLASGPQEYGVRVPGPLARLSLVTGLRPPSTRPGPRPAKRPPLHHRVRPEPIPTQARASAAGGYGTGQQGSKELEARRVLHLASISNIEQRH